MTDLRVPTEENASASAIVRRVARSGIWFALGYVVSAGSGFAVAVIAGRALGPAGFGRFSYWFWATRLAATVFAVGTPAVLSRFVPEYIGRGEVGLAHGALRLVLRANAVIAPVAGFAVGAFAYAKEGDPALALVLGGTTALALFAVQLEGLLSGLRRFPSLARVAFFAGASQITVATVALTFNFGWSGYLILLGLATAVPVMMSWRVARTVTAGCPPLALGRFETSRLVRFAGMMTFITLANEVVWGRPELFFLEHYRGSAAVGLYSAGLRLSSVIVILPALAARVLLPEFSWLNGGGREAEMRQAYRTVCRYVAVMGVPLAIGGAAVADLLVKLVYGPGFAGASTAAAILLAGSLGGAIVGAVSAAVFAGPRASIIAKVGAGIVVLNVVLDIVLISRWGLVGAALATAISQGLGAAIGLWYAATRLHLPYPFREIGAMIACGLVSAGAARLGASLLSGPALQLAGAVATGAVVYIALVIAMRIVTPSELRAVLPPSLRRDREATP